MECICSFHNGNSFFTQDTDILMEYTGIYEDCSKLILPVNGAGQWHQIMAPCVSIVN